MQSAVQIESEEAALFVSHLLDMNMTDGADISMTDGEGLDAEDPSREDNAGTSVHNGNLESGGDLTEHPEVLAAAHEFRSAAVSARSLSTAEEVEAVDRAVIAHDSYIEALEHLNESAHTGGDAMGIYHGGTQVTEAALRESIQELREGSIVGLAAAVDRTEWTQRLLRIMLPIAGGGALVAAIWLTRTRNTRHRVRFLEHVISEKDRFIGTVSHELRTPLSAIVGFAQLLSSSESELSDSDKREYNSHILTQGNEVTAIVDDLLVAARAEIGQLTMVEVPVNLGAQAHQVVEILPLPPDTPVQYDHDVQALGDPVRVRQILRNLLTNALRYGGSDIRVEVEDSHDMAVLRVVDDGNPISEEDRDRLFEPYTTLEGGRPVTGSIGLGLSVSRQLARLMDGDLQYISDSGQSVFELTLPLADQERHHQDADSFSTLVGTTTPGD
jgi:signal transduction histidine kinase